MGSPVRRRTRNIQPNTVSVSSQSADFRSFGAGLASIIVFLSFHLTAHAELLQPDLQYFPSYSGTQICDGSNFMTSRMMYLKFGTQELRQHGCELDDVLHVEDQRDSSDPGGHPVTDWFKLDVKNRSVSGSASIHSIYNRGGGGAYHWRAIYTDAVPEASLRAEIYYSLMAYGKDDAGTLTHGAGIGFRDISRSVVNTIEPQNGLIEVDVFPYSAMRLVDGTTYYSLGTVGLSGQMSGGGPGYIFGTGAFSAQITDIKVYYNGNVLKKVDGDNTWYVNKKLPKQLTVQVVNNRTGEPYTGAPIRFWVVNSEKGGKFENGETSIQVQTSTAGIASVPFWLGSSTGEYLIKTSCLGTICNPGAREVAFKATAGTIDLKTLGDVSCESNSARNQRTPAMRVGAYDSVINEFVYQPVYYDRISFTDTNDYTTPSFAAPIIYRHIKKPMNFRSFTLGPLKTSGTYTFQVSCPDCLGTKTVICRSYVRDTDAPIGPPQAYTANPYDRDAEGKPYTPVVRVAEVVTQNTNESFTTHETENFVEFRAQVLPEDFAEQSVITWDVIDDPTDNYASALPRQGPVPDPGDKFRGVYRVWLDNEADGRPAPLRYLVTAKATVEEQQAVSSYRLKQDEIDKCRQEYMDIPQIHQYTPDYMSQIVRSTFTLGVSGEYVIANHVRDCYAYIFPHQRAAEVQRLRGLLDFGINVTGGYRSPRKNFATEGASERSWHMFGKAVDIEPAPESAANYQVLWSTSSVPKILERRTSPQVILKRDSNGTLTVGNESTDSDDSKIPDVFENANWMHLGE